VNKNLQTLVSRRSFLRGTALAGASAVGIFNAFYGFSRVLGQDAANDDTQTIINIAATAELFATTHYLAAINSAEDLGLDEIQLNYMKAGFLAEQDHLELLVSLGATPLFNEFYVPENLFTDKDLFSETTELAETVFVAAYLAAARIWSEGGAETAPFAVTAAQIATTEAEHRALVRQLGGRLATNQSYAQYLVHNVSDGVPILMPFLDGSGDGFVGPVAPPTEDDIATIKGEADAIGYTNTGRPFPLTEFANASSRGSDGGCVVTAGGADVNIREAAGTDSNVIAILRSGESTAVDGVTTGSDGQNWWRVTSGGFVRSDTVTASDTCSSVPQV
jgi:hypothetical protein